MEMKKRYWQSVGWDELRQERLGVNKQSRRPATRRLFKFRWTM